MKFRLLERAYIDDQILEAEVEIGDGTKIPSSKFTPGPHMEPIDKEAKEAFQKWRDANPQATLDIMNRLPL